MECQESFITKKPIWHSYLNWNLDNCAMKLCTKTGLIIERVLKVIVVGYCQEDLTRWDGVQAAPALRVVRRMIKLTCEPIWIGVELEHACWYLKDYEKDRSKKTME